MSIEGNPVMGFPTSALLILVAWCAPALAQSAPDVIRPVSFGSEIELKSGHADRGFLISDRAVIQPEMWLSSHGATLDLWSSFNLASTSDGSRPRIFELEATREQHWKRFTVVPAVTAYFYSDRLSSDRDQSVEGWLHVTYAVGALRLFTNHSLDVATYPGAYSGDVGIGLTRQFSPRNELSGSIVGGWASAAFNNAWADVSKAGFDRFGVTASWTRHLNQVLYVGSELEFSTIIMPALRAALPRPSYVLAGLSFGVER